MRLGFRHTAFQAVCTVLVLCFAIGLLERADTVQPVFGEDSVRVPILMYHSILKDSARQGKYVISPAVLAADLDALQVKGYTAITVSDLLAYVQDGADLPEKPVMITFDDGYYNNYIYAYPLLKQRGMKAVVSITIDDEFVVHDIKVIEGEKGLFIAMPSRKATDGEYRDIAHPINSGTREKIQTIILKQYEQAMAEAEAEEAAAEA